MGTKIEWTDETWNPVTGCTKISTGCKNCYAERMAKRLAGRFGYPEAPHQFDVTLHFDRLGDPLKWRKKPRMVFVCSMGDLFHPKVPDDFIMRVFRIMGRSNANRNIFQILTKRPERMRDWVNEYVVDYDNRPAPFKNIWLGVTAENQETADLRIPTLLDTPAAVRFVSAEPLLGPINLDNWAKIVDWVIVGGESGNGFREMDPEWARSIKRQCAEANVPFFMKQMSGRLMIPEDLMVREFPSKNKRRTDG